MIASVLIHVAIAAALFLKLPQWPPDPPKDEAVNVELVPPPEEKPPEKPPEEKKAEAPKPPEKQPEAPKPEEKPAPPPPPPPPPPPEQPKPEEKPQEPPKQDAPKDEQAEKPADPQAKPQSMPVLRPVFEFGDKDAGPKKSEEGDASVASAKPDVEPPADEPKPQPEPPKPVEPPKPADPPPPVEPPKPAEAPQDEPPKPAEPVVADKPPESRQAPANPEPPANPVPQDIEVPKVEAVEANPEKSGPPTESTDEAKTDFALPSPTAPQETKVDAKEKPDAAKPDALEKVKTLFSENSTGDGVATTAMGNVSRGARVGQLCSTELREQLRHSSPAYRPELLPAYRLSVGTVLDVRRGAFRTIDGWYNLSFRCEVDANATKVVSFAFDVGDRVPRSEWRSRRLPEN